MFLFDLIFGKRKQPEEPAAAPAERQDASAPGTRIRHDPQLIARLKDDHDLLLGIHAAIAAAAQAGDFAQVQQRLDHFRTVLMDHLLKENVRLYVYLEHLLAQDPASHRLIREFRHDMDAIGRTVVAFLTKYKSVASQPELAAGFAAELAAIGEVLAARIRREEDTLYALYLSPA